jgi:DNA-binding transcriptional LysR family regulator
MARRARGRRLARDKRATELTPAGRQLLADARPLLANADALRRRVTRAARGPGSFTIGFMPGLIVTAAVRAMLGLHPQLTVDVLCLAGDAARRSRLIQDFAAIAADHPPVASQAEPGRVFPAEPNKPGGAVWPRRTGTASRVKQEGA